MGFDILPGHVSTGRTLGDYYLDFSPSVASIALGAYGPLDGAGIPLVDYDLAFRSRWLAGKNRRTFGVHYTPVTIAQYALGLYGQMIRHEEPTIHDRFLAQVNWLRDNICLMPGGHALWLHWFAQLSYALEPPWASAMAQGQGISALLRAFDFTADDRYLRTAMLAADAYCRTVAEGGVTVRDDRDSLWFEEYPSSPASHVLNGFIFALWGLFDLWRVTGDSGICALWQEGVATLKLNLPRYELGGWSRYDLVRNEKAAYDYHLTHVMQLEVMAQLTGEPLFQEYARRWRQSAESANLRVLSFMRLVRGVLRRLGVLPRPAVTGITVNVPVPQGDLPTHA